MLENNGSGSVAATVLLPRHHVSIMYYDDVGQLSLAVSLACIVIV